jgi:DNA-directed RNA polymerase specialized sigma24 family protein
MNEYAPLSLFYTRYKEGHITAREMEGHVFQHILNSRGCEYGLYFRNRSERADFLCWCYPRMRNAIARYDSGRASFDAYIASTIRYSYRNYRRLGKNEAMSERAFLSANGGELAACEPEPDLKDDETPQAAYRITSPKYAQLVLLKSFYYVSDELVYKAASVIGVNPEVLGGMIDKLHQLQLKKINKAQKLANAAYCQYFRCLKYENQLAGRCENTRMRVLLSARLERGRRRLANMRVRIKSTRIEATNDNLAKVLGIPKGTVDSRLAAIRNKLSGNMLEF